MRLTSTQVTSSVRRLWTIARYCRSSCRKAGSFITKATDILAQLGSEKRGLEKALRDEEGVFRLQHVGGIGLGLDFPPVDQADDLDPAGRPPLRHASGLVERLEDRDPLLVPVGAGPGHVAGQVDVRHLR